MTAGARAHGFTMQPLAMSPGQGHLRTMINSANALGFTAIKCCKKAMGPLCAPCGMRVCDSCESGAGML